MTELQQRKPPKKNESLWLASFSDMSLSLMCFFVLLISTMKPVKTKFENIKDGMVPERTKVKTKKLVDLAPELNKVMKKKKIDDKVTAKHDADGLKIEFKGGFMFSSGSSKGKAEFKKTLQDVMKTVFSLNRPFKLTIEGHTDDVPLRKSGINSNWELSSARGFAVMRMLHRLGVPETDISVVAYAHTKPKVPYKGLKGRELQSARAANRRVVILIE